MWPALFSSDPGGWDQKILIYRRPLTAACEQAGGRGEAGSHIKGYATEVSAYA
jgi:hypothetical protein